MGVKRGNFRKFDPNKLGLYWKMIIFHNDKLCCFRHRSYFAYQSTIWFDIPYFKPHSNIYFQYFPFFTYKFYSTYFEEHSTYPHRQCFRTNVEISLSSCWKKTKLLLFRNKVENKLGLNMTRNIISNFPWHAIHYPLTMIILWLVK